MNPAGLVAILDGHVVGTVVRTRSGTYRFTYETDSRGPGRTPVSLSFPPIQHVATGERVENWLRALLPDNDRAIQAISARFGADPNDPLSLLAAVGKDCAGAIQLCPEHEVDDTLRRTGGLVPLSEADIEARTAQLRTDPNAGWIMPGEHWSLGGAQEKFALRHQGGTWHEAHGSEPTTHIFKTGAQNLRAQALSEHISMRAGALCGLDVAHTQWANFKSETILVVTRFDRVADADGSWRRLHQEDLCQALGVRQKYQSLGGPSPADIAKLLRSRAVTAAQGAANVDRFIDGLVLNAVLAGPDGHARNHVVMLAGDEVRFAPLFDVATGLQYERETDARTMSMAIGGQFDAARLVADDWRLLADRCRVAPERVLDRVRELAERIPGTVRTALDEVDDWDGEADELARRLLPAIDAHARTLTAPVGPRPRAAVRGGGGPRRARTTTASTPGSFAPRVRDEPGVQLS